MDVYVCTGINMLLLTGEQQHDTNESAVKL